MPDLPQDVADRVEVTPPRDPAHGDMATNAAMVAARAAKQPPAKLAAAIAERLRASPEIDEATAAGPGFINLRLNPDASAAYFRSSSTPARPSATARSVPAPRSTWNTSRPIPPAPSMSAIARSALSSVTHSPRCSPRPASTSHANSISTMPAHRSPLWPGPTWGRHPASDRHQADGSTVRGRKSPAVCNTAATISFRSARNWRAPTVLHSPHRTARSPRPNSGSTPSAISPSTR